MGTRIDRWSERAVLAAMLAAILAALATKFALVSRIAINWDEFYFLEHVYQYLRGDLSGRLQTFHVHFFAWLPATVGSEIDQIIAGRTVMQVLALGSGALTYAIARRFATLAGALFATLSYLAVNTVIEHSASFRLDPMVTFLSLLALNLALAKPRAWAVVGAAAVMALATMLTIKSVFYLTVIGIVFAIGVRVKDAVLFAGAFLVALAGLYVFHDATLAATPVTATGAFLGSTAAKVFDAGIITRGFGLLSAILANPIVWLMLAHGAVIAFRQARLAHLERGWQRWLPLVVALPVLTPLVYRNAFPYFYPFILAPAVVLIGIAFDRYRERTGPFARALVLILIVANCSSLWSGISSRLTDRTIMQRATLAAVHEAFPDPVSLIEGFGAVSAFPRVGFFMSGWGIENYRAAGKPVFADLVAEEQPPLLLADSPSLYAAMVPGVETTRALLDEDVKFLRENYVRYRGMVFVAGKELRGSETFEIAVAGDYRFVAAEPAVIDGRSVKSNDVVTLALGKHRIDGEGTLYWAAVRLAPPAGRNEPGRVDPLTFFDQPSWGGLKPEAMEKAEAPVIVD